MTSIYLDHNATTPIDPAVIDAMEPFFRVAFGNPSSAEHRHGHEAAVAVEEARQHVAAAIGAKSSEIVFTGSCTESNNIALLGAARAEKQKRHLITTCVEHPSVLEPMRALEREGWRVTYLPVDEFGQVSVPDVEAAMTHDTFMVSVMGANNEVGTTQPIQAIGELCSSEGVLFHTDIAQLVALGDVNVTRDNIHIASLSAHKAYGPKGVGALYIRSRRPRVTIAPLLYGGGQERGLRPGTLNTPLIVGMGKAFALAKESANLDRIRLYDMSLVFCKTILNEIPGVALNGHPVNRLANNLSFSIDGIEPLALMRSLRDEISFSASSACASSKFETSHVLKAMFGDTWRARAAFRIAFGRFTAEADMAQAATLIIKAVYQLRQMSTGYV